MGGQYVNFASLEGVIIHKIIAGRPRDLEDIHPVMLKNPDYDLGYIKKWLSEFDMSLGEEYIELFKKTLDSLTE